MKRIERRAREAETDAGLRSRQASLIADHPFRWAFIATLGVIVAVGITSAILSISGVVFSVFAAVFITLGLDPLVRWFQRRGMKRGFAIVTVIVFFRWVAAERDADEIAAPQSS